MRGDWQDIHPVELLLLATVGTVLAAAAPVWAGAQLASLLHTGHPAPVGLVDAAHATVAWAHHPGDPAAGFPPARSPAWAARSRCTDAR